jgi:hypothetical protein
MCRLLALTRPSSFGLHQPAQKFVKPATLQPAPRFDLRHDLFVYLVAGLKSLSLLLERGGRIVLMNFTAVHAWIAHGFSQWTEAICHSQPNRVYRTARRTAWFRWRVFMVVLWCGLQ